MNIFEYQNYKSDVEIYFSAAIERFNLKINTSFNIPQKPITNFVFLENLFCIICLDNISAFPYPDISESFFVKNGNEIAEINQEKLRVHLGIQDQNIFDFITNHRKLLTPTEGLNDSEYGPYRYGINLIQDVMLEFYSPLLKGEIRNELLLTFTKIK